MNTHDQLTDQHGRKIEDLRVSVTDRCNFRCTYCMPAAGLPWIKRDEILSFEEITRLVGILSNMGVSSIRLTGGEPLVRHNLPDLVRMLRALPGVQDLAVTTNGYLLQRQAAALVQAGMQRFNVSLDSLSHARFIEITRRNALTQVLTGLQTLTRFQSKVSVKINTVTLRGITEKEAIAFALFARTYPFQVRFIEFMPLDADQTWTTDKLITGKEMRSIIEEVSPLEEIPRRDHATAKVFRFVDGQGEIGFINPISEPFCHDCNRIRLTAEGTLRTCLFSLHETDLKEPLRSGANDDELADVIRQAVWRKELKHAIGQSGFRQPDRTMSRIGG